MILLDENVLASQRQLLRSWHIPARQIGREVGRKGLQDQEILSLLHRLSSPTFFTRDRGFYNRKICHKNYCIVYLDLRKEEVAVFVRRVLRHPRFNTKRKRMGIVMHVSHTGIRWWEVGAEQEQFISW